MGIGQLATIRKALVESAHPDLRKAKSWREDLAYRVGPNNQKLNKILLELAEGIPYQVELGDGMLSAPIVPTPDVRLRAAMYLDEKLNGKAVAQTEIRKAEEEERERAAVRALTEDELYAEAQKILARRRNTVIDVGPVTDAEIVEEPLNLQECVDQIWDARYDPAS
jgi:hypothetical protein